MEFGRFRETLLNLQSNLPLWLNGDILIEVRIFGQFTIDGIRVNLPVDRMALLIGIDPDRVLIDDGMGSPLLIEDGRVDGFAMIVVPQPVDDRISQRPC